MMFVSGVSLPAFTSGTYVDDLPVVTALRAHGALRFTTPITFIVGENGSGKSTLLEAIAVSLGFSPEGGSRNMNFSGVDAVSELHRYLTVTRPRNPRDGYFVRAESMYRAYTYLDKINDGRQPLMHPNSHGEATMELVRHRFHGSGLFLMDEPESGLSFDTSVELAGKIEKLAAQGAQFIIATHSPILLGIPGAQILEITENGLGFVPYDECELVQAYREFLADPHGTAQYLVNGE
ncbi:AAA family ATPase [Corynebacterium hindlerae]|uniref:AAA family ATPase n=1 Tax=Corynebacterium hindlerae TaxID=699041 RepID=UPI003AB0D437